MASLARLAQHAIAMTKDTPQGRLGANTWRIGGPLVFQRLWEETGCQEVVQDLLQNRDFEFPRERILFATVLTAGDKGSGQEGRNVVPRCLASPGNRLGERLPVFPV